MDAHARVYVAKISRREKWKSVVFACGVKPPETGDRYTTIEIECEGSKPVLLVFTTANFYVALGTVMKAALPASNGIKLS